MKRKVDPHMLQKNLNDIQLTTKTDAKRAYKQIYKLAVEITKNAEDIFNYDLDLMDRAQSLIAKAIGVTLFEKLTPFNPEDVTKNIHGKETELAIAHDTTIYIRNAKFIAERCDDDVDAKIETLDEVLTMVDAALECWNRYMEKNATTVA